MCHPYAASSLSLTQVINNHPEDKKFGILLHCYKSVSAANKISVISSHTILRGAHRAADASRQSSHSCATGRELFVKLVAHV